MFWSVHRFERTGLGIYNILLQRNPSQDSCWIDAIASHWPLCAVVASVLPLHMLMRGGIVGSKALRCSVFVTKLLGRTHISELYCIYADHGLQWISGSEPITLSSTSTVLSKCLNVPAQARPVSLVRWTGQLQGMASPRACMHPKHCISIVMTKSHLCRVIRGSPKVSLVNCCLHEALQFGA